MLKISYIILIISSFLFSTEQSDWERKEDIELEKARKEEMRKHDPSWIYTEGYEWGYNAGVKVKKMIKKYLFDDDKS